MVDVDSGKIIEFESHEIGELQRKIAADHGYEAGRALAGAVRAQEAEVGRSGHAGCDRNPRPARVFRYTVDSRHAWMIPSGPGPPPRASPGSRASPGCR